MPQRAGAAFGPPFILRRRYEREERVGEHAAPRVRRKRPGFLRQTAAIPRLRQGVPELRQPDPLPGTPLSIPTPDRFLVLKNL